MTKDELEIIFERIYKHLPVYGPSEVGYQSETDILDLRNALFGQQDTRPAKTTGVDVCETCKGDPVVCSEVPSLRHCEAANRAAPQNTPAPDRRENDR